MAVRSGCTTPGDSNIKGVATDDRGNVFVGIAHAPSESIVTIAVVSAEGKRQSSANINEDGEFGVNGVVVYKKGNSYLLYVVTNYGPNRIYAYDVTAAANPTFDKSFGVDGVVNLKTLTGNDSCEGNCSSRYGRNLVSGSEPRQWQQGRLRPEDLRERHAC